MPTKVIIKHSTTTSAVPASGDLDIGEIALNTEDRRLYTKNSSGNIVEVANNPSGLEIGGEAVTASVDELNILDGAVITTAELNTLDGITNNVQDQIDSLTYGTFTPEKYTGDGSTVAFTLPLTVPNENALNIYIDGVYQEKSAFSVSGTTLTFSEAPPLNASIEVIYYQMTELASTGTVVVDRYTTNGVLLNYSLSGAPANRNTVNVYLNGVYQNKNTYTVSGSYIYFDEPFEAGNELEIVQYEVLPLGTTDSDSVSYVPAVPRIGVERTVQDKLRETVSVKDFGAVGDGVTDDTAAIQAALDIVLANGGELLIPSGLYVISGLSGTISSGVQGFTIRGQGRSNTRFLVKAATASSDGLFLDMYDGATNRSCFIYDIGFSSVGTPSIGRNALFVKNASRSKFSNIYAYGFAGGVGIKLDTDSATGCDFNEVDNCHLSNCFRGIEFDCTGASYSSANFISKCSVVNSSSFDIYLRNTGSGSSNAHFISDTWIQCATGVHGLYIADDVSSCKITNLAVDGTPTDIGITVVATADNNVFVNTSLDGLVSDLSDTTRWLNSRQTGAGSDLGTFVQAGTTTISVSASTSGTSSTITFPKPFASTPHITVTAKSGGGFWAAMYTSESATSFLAKIEEVTGTNRTGSIQISWVAVEVI